MNCRNGGLRSYTYTVLVQTHFCHSGKMQHEPNYTQVGCLNLAFTCRDHGYSRQLETESAIIDLVDITEDSLPFSFEMFY